MSTPTAQVWHELKTDPEAYDAVADGSKTHEIRKNDRGFKVGDGLLLRKTRYTGAQMSMWPEIYPLEYTGDECRRIVSHITANYGLEDGWVVLSLAPVAAPLAFGIPAAPVAAVPPEMFQYVILQKAGEIPRRIGPLPSKSLVESTLREAYTAYPDCICIVVKMPEESYPKHGREWLDMYGDRRKPRLVAAPVAAVPQGNLTDQVNRARRHGYLDALSEGTARGLVQLLRRGVAQLEAWHRKYGEHQPEWLPPAGDVRWLEDVSDALNARAPSQAVPLSDARTRFEAHIRATRHSDFYGTFLRDERGYHKADLEHDWKLWLAAATVAAVPPRMAAPRYSNWAWQHVKTGGEYNLLGDARVQTDTPLSDMTEVYVYQGADERLWVRPVAEFNAKFKRVRPLAAAPSQAGAQPTKDQLAALEELARDHDYEGSAQARAEPTPPPNIGDYVLATKYADGDPGDMWALGYYNGESDGRHYVLDAKGMNIRGNGFRRVARIRPDVGHWLLKDAALVLERCPPGTVNLWSMLTAHAFDLSSSGFSEVASGAQRAAQQEVPAPAAPMDDPYREMLADQAEAIDMRRLSTFLARMGIAAPEGGLEHLTAHFGEMVNAITLYANPAPAAREVLQQVLDVLVGLEWSDFYYDKGGQGQANCPECGGDRGRKGDRGHGHTADCALVKAVASLRALIGRGA